MIHFLCLSFLTVLLYLLPFSLVAYENPLRLGIVNIEGVLEEGRPDLPYNRFLDALFSDLESAYTATFLPHARTHKWLQEDKLTCSFPDNKKEIAAPDDYLQSIPVNSVNAHIFSLHHTYTHMEQLHEKVVLHLAHYAFDGLMDEYDDVSYVPVDSPLLAFRLLQQGRADAYIEYVPDIFQSLQVKQTEQLQYDLSVPLKTLHDRFLCVKSHATLQLMKRIDDALIQYHQSGKLLELLGTSYGHPPSTLTLQ